MKNRKITPLFLRAFQRLIMSVCQCQELSCCVVLCCVVLCCVVLCVCFVVLSCLVVFSSLLIFFFSYWSFVVLSCLVLFVFLSCLILSYLFFIVLRCVVLCCVSCLLCHWRFVVLLKIARKPPNLSPFATFVVLEDCAFVVYPNVSLPLYVLMSLFLCTSSICYSPFLINPSPPFIKHLFCKACMLLPTSG